MKLLIDANILLDVLQKREPYYQDSSTIWKLCETEQVQGFVSVLTLANIVYVMRKELTPRIIEEILEKLGLIFEFTELSTSDLFLASRMKWDDFEDAMQSATAHRIHADFIITRNGKDFRESSVSALAPKEFLASFLA